MKKFLVLVVTVITLVVMTVSPMVFAANGTTESEAQIAADTLYSYGLFKGVGTNSDNTPDFALDREPTRQEAVVMLVRLLGKEDQALTEDNEAPFKDVQNWAMPYVGYAYENGLAKGVSTTEFGAQNKTSASQFMTFVLRALGYEDGTDFSWKNPFELSDKIGLVNGKYSSSTSKFTRGDAAIISNEALGMQMSGSNSGDTLYGYLIKEGAIETVSVNGDEDEDLIQSIISENILETKVAENNASDTTTSETKAAENNSGSTTTETKVYLGEFKLTFYCPCSKCCGKSDGITATGTKATEGRTIAVDKTKIPLGSKVYIEGWGTYIAEDTGGAIKSNKIDIFVSSHSKALQYGVQYAKVYIIK